MYNPFAITFFTDMFELHQSYFFVSLRHGMTQYNLIECIVCFTVIFYLTE